MDYSSLEIEGQPQLPTGLRAFLRYYSSLEIEGQPQRILLRVQHDRIIAA